VNPGSDPTQWELHRAIERLRQDQTEGLAQLRDDLRADIAVLLARIEQAVTKDVYAADQRAQQLQLDTFKRELSDLERQMEADATRAATTRRLVITAFVAPLGLFALQLTFAALGWPAR
jgi:hypothetical protein